MPQPTSPSAAIISTRAVSRWPSSVVVEARTFEAILTSEHPVRMWIPSPPGDDYIEVDEVLLTSGVDLSRAPGMPLLDSHCSFGTQHHLGQVDSIRAEIVAGLGDCIVISARVKPSSAETLTSCSLRRRHRPSTSRRGRYHMLEAIIHAMQAAASALSTIGSWCWWAAHWTVSLPARLLGGGSGGSVPHPSYQPPEVDPTADLAALVDKRGRAGAIKGALPSDLEPRADGSDPVATAVLAYARSLPSERDRVNLAALSPDQLGWLLGKSADNLQRMAAAGGLVCGRLAAGAAGGALGVKPCRRREPEPQLDEPDLTDRGPVARLDYAPGFASRVDSMRPSPRRRRAA